MFRFLSTLLAFVGAHAFAQVPNLGNIDDESGFGGSEICTNAVLTNTGNTGYGPYLRLSVPPGLTFASAESFGSSVAANVVGVFPAAPNNTLTDPITNEPITGTPGEQLIMLQPPIGSVVSGGIPLDMKTCFTIDTSAPVNVPLDVTITPVYQFGDTPTGVNGPIIGTAQTFSITPTLVTFTKTTTAPERERPPGASWPTRYTLTVNIAENKTLSQINLSDTLPPFFILDNSSLLVTPAGCTVNTSGNPITADCGTITGTGGADVVLTYQGYYDDILNETSCDTDVALNNASFDADFAGTAIAQQTVVSQVAVEHLTVQKTAGSSSNIPGDALAFTLNAQLSDYANASRVTITDVLPNGLSFTGGSATIDTGAGAVSITPVISNDTPSTGQTTLVFDVTAAVGGDLSAGSGVTINYNTLINQGYAGTGAVLANDQLNNTAKVSYDLTAGASACENTTAAQVNIAPITVEKRVLSGPGPYLPGQTVTYLLSAAIPSGDTRSLVFSDYFPLPVFDISTTTFTFGGNVRRHSSDSMNLTPVLTKDNATNSLKITWPDISTGAAQVVAVEVDVIVTDTPFADNLSLSNLMRVTSENTGATESAEVAPVLIQTRAPELTMTKGVAATDNPAGVIAPSPGVLPIDGDVSAVDAGDAITFTLTVENSGGAPAYDVVVTDSIPAGLTACAVPAVRNNAGTVAATNYTVSVGSDITVNFSNDILGAGAGALAAADSFYLDVVCTLGPGVMPNQVLSNTAGVTWASVIGATAFPAQTDTASVTVADPTINKTLTQRIHNGASVADLSQITAGDVLTYDIAVTLPEGTANAVTLTDTLPAGLTYLNASLDSSGFSGTVALGTVTTAGQTLTLPLATVTTDSNLSSDNTFIVRVQAQVGDSSPGMKTNTVSLDYTGRDTTISDSASSQYVEPALTVNKAVSPSNAIEAGDTLTYSITVGNNGGSPAYDVEISDSLDSAALDLNSITLGAVPAGLNCQYINPTISCSGGSLAAGDSLTFTFTANAADTVVSGSRYRNTAAVNASSQTGNVAGEVQVTGSDSATFTVQRPSVAKAVIATSEDWTDNDYTDPNIPVAIGEVVTYRLTYTLPEGVTRARTPSDWPMFRDRLPAGFEFISALYYAVSDTTMTYQDSAGVDVAFPAGIANATAITPTITSFNGEPRNVLFEFGNISNDDNDSNAEQVIFEVKALVKNTGNNQRNANKLNRAWIYHRSTVDTENLQATASDTVRIAEPVLRINKSVNPSSAAGGDEITFTVEIRNRSLASATRAWEVVAKDPLPGQYVDLSLSASDADTSVTLNSSTPARDGLDLMACASVSQDAVTNVWQWQVALVDCLSADQAYLDPDETITVVYQGLLAPTVAFGAVVPNTAAVAATSLPGSNGGAAPGAPGSLTGERTGSGVDANDLTVSDSANVTINTPSISKSVADAALPVGAITTATLNISLPVGTTENFVITDVLPTGLRYTGGDIVITKPSNVVVNTTGSQSVTINGMVHALNNGSNVVSGSAAVDGDGANAALTFDFGHIAVSAGDGLVITYPVQVQNVLGNQRLTSLDNTAMLTYNGYDSNNPPSSSARITVVEANIETDKSITSTTTGVVAGDTVTYELRISNIDATATAYRVHIADVLPLALLGGAPNSMNAVTLVNTNHVVLTGTSTDVSAADHSITTTTASNDTLSFPLLDMPPNSSVTITYQVTVANNAPVGANLSNTLSVDYHSLPAGLPNSDDGRNGSDSLDDDNGDLNNYGETSSETLTLASSIALAKSLPGGAATQYSIGETVDYDIRINLLEGSTENVAITDTLPVGMVLASVDAVLGTDSTHPPAMTYTAGTVVANTSGSGTAADPTVVSINLGDITLIPDSYNDNDYVVVRLTLRVDNHVDNDNGDDLTNTATVSSDNAGSATDSQTIRIVEPIIAAEKTASNATPALGEVVTFTVRVSHQAGSGSTAYDLVMTDTLPAGMTFVPGSESGQAACDPSPCVATTLPGGESQLRFSIGSLTLTDNGTGYKTFTYQARVDNAAVVGAGLTNTIDGAYSSLFGDNPNERDGSGTPVQNDYRFSSAATVTPDTRNAIEATKTVALVVDNATPGIADVGDTLEYTVTLSNTAATALTDVVFTDAIPAHTTLLAGSVSSSMGTVTEGNPITVDGIASLAGGDSLTITFQVSIDAGTPTGTVISNQGSVDSNETVPEPTDADGVDANGDQPTTITVGGNPVLENPLVAEKTVELWNDINGNGSVNPGDILRYTITLNNTGRTVLSDVSLNDSLPAGLTYVPTAFASVGTVSVNGQSVDWTGITTIAAGDFVNMVVDVSVDSFTGADQTFDNQASVNYTDNGTVKNTQTDGNGNVSDGNQPTSITATTGAGVPQLDVQKRVALATDNNGNGRANPNDTLTYTITIVNNGSATTQNTRFSDAIDANTTLVAGSVTADYGVVTSGNTTPISVNLGSLRPGEVATVRFSVQINATTPSGTIIDNQAVVNADNLSTPVLSDDNGNPADGINPTLVPVVDDNTTPATAVSKVIVAHSEADSITPAVLIGEVLTYEITVSVPSGYLAEASIVDALPAGMVYLPDSARLKRVFNVGLTASADPAGINSQLSDTFVDLSDGVTLQHNGQNLAVLLGDVINSDTVTAGYTLQYQAVVQNVVGNQDGTALTNSANVSYLDGLNQPAQLTPATTTVTVAEPAVSVQKTVTPMTILPSGGTLTYTLEIANNGNAPAYDLSIEDAMPAGWDLQSVNVAADITDNSDLNAEQVRLGLSRLVNGETRTVTYTVVAPAGLIQGDSIDNTATAAWSSLANDNGSGGETPGAAGSETGERNSGTGVNDYTAAETATVRVGVPVLAKTLQNAQTRYAVGDSVWYQVQLAVPAGMVMDSLLLTDTLDAGLSYISGSLLVDTDGLTLITQPGDFSVAGRVLSFNVGALANNTAETRTLTLTYAANVDNILDNQDGATRGNRAEVTYTDPGTGNAATPLSDAQTITIGEPHLNVTKTLISPSVNLQAGDTVTYAITLENDGNTTAHQTVLADTLPTGLQNISDLQVTAVSPSTQVTPLFDVAADGLSWASQPFDLGVGSRVTLTFAAVIADSVQPQQSIQNRVTADFNSQPDVNHGGRANGRNGNDNGDQDDNSVLNNYNTQALSASFSIEGSVQFDKAFYPDTGNSTYTIGETVGYRLTLQLAEGTLANVVVTDELPAGLVFDEATVGFAHSGMYISGSAVQPTTVNGQTLIFDLGEVSNPDNGQDNDDYLTIDIMAHVENIQSNQDGITLGNHAHVTYDDVNGTPQLLEFDADINSAGNQPLTLSLVEPEVSLSKAVSEPEMSLGDVVTFTLTLAHTADSSADAFNLTVTDVLPNGLTYVPTATPAPVTVNGQTLTFNIAALTLSERDTSITYQARIDNTAVLGQAVTNQATLSYSSLSHSDGRDGSDGAGGLNNYVSSAEASVTPTAQATLEAQKTVALGIDGNQNGMADAGDVLTYTVTIVNTREQAVSQVVFTDAIPANTTYVDGSLVAAGSTSATEAGGVLSVNYAELASGASVLITFDVSIAAGTPIGTVITNQGSVDSEQTVPEATDVDGFDDDGDEPTTIQVGGTNDTPPALAVSKNYRIVDDAVAPIGTNNVGDVVAYDIVVQNTGATPLTQVVLHDSMPGGVTVTAIESSKGTANVSNSIDLSLGTLAPGESVTVTITGTLNAVGIMENQATVSSDELPDVRSDSDGNADNGAQPTRFPVLAANETGAPQLTLDKMMTLAIDSNADANINPSELVRIDMVLQNVGSAVANNVQLNDDLSSLNASLVDYSITTSQGTVISKSPLLSVNIGSIVPGATATVSFLVNAESVGMIDNTATASDASGQSVSGSAQVPVVAFSAFAPPVGEKTVTADALPTLTWRQVWINPNSSYLLPVRIIDPIPANSHYVDGSVVCEVRGISVQTRCEFDAATQQVIFEGRLGADGNASNEASAQHEVVISFDVSVDNPAQAVSNQAAASWDSNGSGSLADDNGVALSNDPGTDAVNDPTLWTPAPVRQVQSIPVMSIGGLLALLLLMLGGVWRLSYERKVK